MKSKTELVFRLNNKEYHVDANKLCYTLKRLSGKEISPDNIKEISDLLKYYDLFREEFLVNVNKI